MLSTVLCAFSSLYTHVLGLSMEEDLRQTFGDNACHPEPFASLKGKLREGQLTGSLISKCLDLRLIPCPLDLPFLAGKYKGLVLAHGSKACRYLA
jgi:hypothetical protein